MRGGLALFAWLFVSPTAATPLQSSLPAQENLLVVPARKVRQASTQAPLELTLTSGKRITVPPQDVHLPATEIVRRAMAGQAYQAVEPSRLFVLHVRDVVPHSKSDVRVTLSSGTVIHLRPDDVNDVRLTFLRTVLAEARSDAMSVALTEAAAARTRELAKAFERTESAESGSVESPPCTNAGGDSLTKELEPWLNLLTARIRRFWSIPASVAHTKKGSARVRFVVHRDGRITDLTLHETSGVYEFNQSALSAVAAANPVEPIPLEYPEPRIVFCLTFGFNEVPKVEQPRPARFLRDDLEIVNGETGQVEPVSALGGLDEQPRSPAT